MTAADTAIAFALAQQGKPYIWGATGPNAFDCSGLVMQAYASAGVHLPRTTYGMLTIGQAVSYANAAPGDLIFPDAGHVQIYLGNGQVVESPHTGASVRVTKVWGTWAIRRVTSPGTGVALATGNAPAVQAALPAGCLIATVMLPLTILKGMFSYAANPGPKQFPSREQLADVFRQLPD